jgi:CelD/BcsL family acetyltransferase involved in cellulose biosynthesis
MTDWRMRILRLTEADVGLTEAWKQLSDDAVEPNPFHDPRFLLTSAEHRSDATSISLAVVEGEHRLQAVMAFTTRKGFARLPLSVRSTIGPFMLQLGDLRHPLVGAEDPVRAWHALLTGLRRSRGPGLLELANLPGDGPLAESLTEAIARLGMAVRERERDDRACAFAHRLSEKETQSLLSAEHSSAGTTKKRARHVRQLEAEVGPLTVTALGADPSAIDRFLHLEAAGWKGDASQAGRALLLTGHDAWFRAVTAAFRADDRLVATALTAGENLLYLGIGLRAGAGVFSTLDAYDERYALYSAGAIGRIAECKSAITTPGVDYFDPNLSSVYRDSARLYPHSRPHVTLLIATGGPASRALLRGGPALRSLRQRLPR